MILVPVRERPELSPVLYDIIDRNRGPLSEFDIPTAGLYPDFSAYDRDIQASLAGSPVPSSDVLCEFYAMVERIDSDDVVVGGFDVVISDRVPDSSRLPSVPRHIRTIGYYVDLDGGHGRHGYASHAVYLASRALLADVAEIDFIDAYVHRKNMASRKVLTANLFSLDHAYRGRNLHYIRSAIEP